MILSFTKYFFIFLCCIYIYRKLLNERLDNHAGIILYVCISVGLASLSYLIKQHYSPFTAIIPTTLLWLIVNNKTKQPQLSYVAIVFSYALSYGTFCIANIIVLFCATLIRFFYSFDSFELLMLFSGILTCVLTHLIFQIKRLRAGMPFLHKQNFLNLGTFLCILFDCVLVFIQNPTSTEFLTKIVIPFLLPIPIILLMYWWQSQINKSYLAKLQALELESLRNELSEQSRLVESLRLQNAEFGRVQHQYRKLYPALETAVKDLIQKYPEESAHFEQVLAEIHSQESHYNEAIQAIAHICPQTFNSKIPELDTLLSYMDKQAQSKNISFAAYIQDDFAEHILKDVESADINHMLSDLLENAIIATAGSTISKIRLQMYYYQNASVIEIADTGIPFEVQSLLQLGLSPLTTHGDSGGGGIGLMDLWSLKKKYRASLHITEYPELSSFHKKIGLVFDKADRYLLSSPRFEELASQSNRVDINILPYTEESQY